MVTQNNISTQIPTEYYGLAADSKPHARNGSIFHELDTGKTYHYDAQHCTWIAEAAKYLASISITTPPTKTEYLVGESFDPTGMVITATYSDGTTATVANPTVLPESLSIDDTYIVIDYTENGIMRSAEQEITVTAVEIELASISISTPPTKTGYRVGESFDPSGMVITATYSNGDTEDVTTGCSFSPDDELTTEDTSITISYTEGEITKTADQAITVTETQQEG